MVVQFSPGNSSLGQVMPG